MPCFNTRRQPLVRSVYVNLQNLWADFTERCTDAPLDPFTLSVCCSGSRILIIFCTRRRVIFESTGMWCCEHAQYAIRVVLYPSGKREDLSQAIACGLVESRWDAFHLNAKGTFTAASSRSTNGSDTLPVLSASGKTEPHASDRSRSRP